MTDSSQPITSPLEEKDLLLPKELYFCNSLEPEEENQAEYMYDLLNVTEFAHKFSVQRIDNYLLENGIPELELWTDTFSIQMSWPDILGKNRLLRFLLTEFYSIIDFSEKTISGSKLRFLRRAFAMYDTICGLECNDGKFDAIPKYFRKCLKNALTKLENIFGNNLLDSFRQISEKKLRYQDGFPGVEISKEYRVFSKEQWSLPGSKPEQLSSNDYSIFTLDRMNPNLEDIFFAVNDFLLPMNAMGRTNCTIIWERSALFFEDKHVIESLDLCSPNSWYNFLGNVTDFFCVTRFTPIQEEINKSRRSQQINMMKITANLGDDSKILRRPIKKLPKRTALQTTSGNEDVGDSKRQYLKKKSSYRYWINRKNPQHQELIEWSRNLMEGQKEKDKKGPATS